MWVQISGPAGIVGEGVNNLSPPSIPRLRCPWARHRTPNCSPGAVTWLPTAPGVCSLMDWLNAENTFHCWLYTLYITCMWQIKTLFSHLYYFQYFWGHAYLGFLPDLWPEPDLIFICSFLLKQMLDCIIGQILFLL